MARQSEGHQLGELARMLRTDGGMNLWETVDGPLWIPENNPYPKGGFRGTRWASLPGMVEPPIQEGDVVIDRGGHWGKSAAGHIDAEGEIRSN